MGFTFKVTTNTSNLNVRTGPDTTHQIVGSMPKGTMCHSDGQTSKDSIGRQWYHMDQGTYAGRWCCATYCTVTGQDPAATPATVPAVNVSTNSSAEGFKKAQAIKDRIQYMVDNRAAGNKNLAHSASMRLFGLPHQLIEHNDFRISDSSKLGRMFTETFVMDAPLIYLKPGKSNYLPGMSSEEKYAYTSLFTSLAKDSDTRKSLANEIADLMNSDDLRYFDFSQAFAEYLQQVNLLCRIGAVFLDLDKTPVPWANNATVTYGNYDWRYYTFQNIYDTASFTVSENAQKAGNLAAFVENAIGRVDSTLADDKYIQFYVDANASFSEDASNDTTSSMINGFVDQVSEIGKELQFASGVTGADISGLMNDVTGGVDDVIQDIAKGGGVFSTFLRRLTGVGSQLLAGSNFLAPDIWNDSKYGKNYSFTVSLSTPYGSKEAWYLNIYVPLMHLLAMALPVQTSANTYSAPFLVRVFCPGWFSCDMGIIDSIGLSKGDDGSWTTSGLPSEIKVSISIKDLYANLALPDGYSIKKFFNNNGLLNFLMVNCGVDITKTGLEDKIGVFANLFSNTISDVVSETTYGVWYNIQEGLRNTISLYYG